MQDDSTGTRLEEDFELVERLKQGKPGAIDEVVRTYQKPLYSFIVRMVENRETADDVFQETWIRVIRHIGSFRGDSRFTTWLFQIALNQVRNAVRKQSRRSFVDIEDVAQSLAVDPDVDADQIVMAGKVKKMLAGMPAKMREVIVLRYYHDKSEQEIAAVIGKPVGTVKSRLHRATHMLREKMETFQSDVPTAGG